MFHVEIRSGMQVVREFNLDDRRLWVEFLAPLMADHDFMLEGHEFIPRQTRLKVYEGPELRPDQLGMGRGWQNVERSAEDVTERVLARAREHTAAATATAATATAATATAAAASAGSAPDLLRERLIGRISAGPIAAREILSIAAELMPDAGEGARLEASRQAVWALLQRELAQLTPSGR